MTSRTIINVICALIGAAGGATLALLGRQHPEWALQHPGSILLAAVGVALLAGLAVQVRMNRAQRDHERRAEAFRLSMIARFAPDRLEVEQSAR